MPTAPNTPWLGWPPGQQAAFVKAFCAEMDTAEIEAVRTALAKAMRDVDPQGGCDWLSSRGKQKKVDLAEVLG